MILIKTIESTNQGVTYESIFGQPFIDAHMPNWQPLQLVVELNSTSVYVSPEVFDIKILSDIVG